MKKLRLILKKNQRIKPKKKIEDKPENAKNSKKDKKDKKDQKKEEVKQAPVKEEVAIENPEATKESVNKKDKKEKEKKGYKLKEEKEDSYINCSNNVCGIRVDTSVDDEMMDTYLTRELLNCIQTMRKEKGVQVTDDIFVYVGFDEEKRLEKAVANNMEFFMKVLKVGFTNDKSKVPEKYKDEAHIELGVKVWENIKVDITLYK